MSTLKPGQTVLIYAQVRKVEEGTEGASAVVQVGISPAPGFSQTRDATIVIPAAAVHSVVAQQEALQTVAQPLGRTGATREELVAGTIAGSRQAPNSVTEFLPGQQMTRVEPIQATELSPSEAVEAAQYVRQVPGCREDFGNDEAAALALELMAGTEPETIEAKFLRGWLREQGKVTAL